ncbi:hypothetical protein CDAR_573351 [Caerostris darwini]|uniref:ATP synthase F0 subunit 8 n=1 Tax=Caerostris darwini TaxID=1538125 RepID=A0AAV4VN48_9ARAC|nr:hypothetical protein CDAR_573351 [Caerostris darwini]
MSMTTDALFIYSTVIYILKILAILFLLWGYYKCRTAQPTAPQVEREEENDERSVEPDEIELLPITQNDES